jgi:hypothetical protein
LKKNISQIRKEDFEDVAKLEARLHNLKKKQDEMWLMRSPPRLEQVDSPPYIVVKTEDDENHN